MEIKATLTEDGWKEIIDTLYIRRAIILFVSLLVFVLAIFTLVVNSMLARICILIGGIIACFFGIYGYSNLRKTLIARYTEGYAGNTVEYIYQFGDSELNIRNLTAGSDTVLQYSDIKSYKKTEHYAILFTQGGYTLAMGREAAEQADIKAFVKKRNPALKS